MRSRRGLPFTLSRMGMHRPVLAMAAVLTLITAALIATLAAFASQALVEDKGPVRVGDDGSGKGRRNGSA